jgi:hypothetical protein
MKQKLIRATELAEVVYCSKAWHLKYLGGAEVSLEARQLQAEALADGQGHVLSCGDVRDNIIQEYIAFGIGFIPVCSDFTQTAHSVYFTFAEINVTGDYTWALILAGRPFCDRRCSRLQGLLGCDSGR